MVIIKTFTLLTMKIVINKLWLFVILISFSCSGDPENDLDLVDEPNNSLTTFELELLARVNDHRRSQGLEILHYNEIAYQAALSHTNYMITEGSISHDGFNQRAEDLFEKLGAESVSENVASRFNTAEDVINAWLNSLEGHRENIEGNFTHTAIAARKDANGDYFYTQLFYR